MQVERPRIALNAQLLRINQGYRSAGIARYIYHLLRELPAAATDFELDVYTTESRAPALLNNVKIYSSRVPAHKPLARIFWEQTVFAWRLYQTSPALLHSLAYVSPLLHRTRGIVTLYDLSFYLYPKYFRPFHRLYLQLGTRISARRAERILTISASTRRDVVRLLNVPENKIDVAMPGVNPEFFQTISPRALQVFRRAQNLPELFVLYLGTREPRKNIPSLIRAFALLKRHKKFPHRLVLAGGRGWMDDDIARVARETDMQGEILFPGFVPHADLPFWYRAADAFVYPSQYEGFGLPVLEALASGTPTITSNVSSLPEAGGNAALLVNPAAPQEIADALARLLTDDALRQELKTRGVEHARQFTWARAAQVTAQCYRTALGVARQPSVLETVPR